MKTLITTLALAFSVFSVTASACEQFEMQFIGKATHVNRHSFNQNTKHICSYEIQLTQANSSVTCPLSDSEVSSVRFVDVNCSLTEGSEISGVIVRRGSTFWVE